jgi:ABC-type multidrug transport system permease subunit
MLRQLALGLGLLLDFCGMIVFLSIVVNRNQYWYDSASYSIGQWSVNYGVFMAFVALGATAIIAGFAMLCVGILYPHQTLEATSEKEEDKNQ